MLKILQAGLQQYVNCELPDVQASLKAEEPEIKLLTSAGSWKKQDSFRKTFFSYFIDYAKDFDCVDHNKLWDILEETVIPDHLICLLRNLCAGQEAKLELDMEQWTGSKLGKEYVKAVYCHPAYLTSMQSTSCKMLGQMKNKLKSRLPGEISITSDTQMTPPLWQKVKRNWGASWKWKKSEKAGSKLNIQKTKIIASSPIASW